MRACILAAVFALYSVASAQAQAQAERSTFCLESAARTCVDVAIETQPSAAGGTDVSIRIADVTGQFGKDVGGHAPWYRLHRLDLNVADAAFAGGDISTAAGATLVGAAQAIGEVPLSSPSITLFAPDRHAGYSIATAGADIVGCTIPPGQRRPYLRTCGVDGRGEILFRFSTTGTWQAGQMTLVIALHDADATNRTCIVSGTLTANRTTRAAQPLDRCEPRGARAPTSQS